MLAFFDFPLTRNLHCSVAVCPDTWDKGFQIVVPRHVTTQKLAWNRFTSDNI
ncbi:hypothetical protein DEDE109153_01565 [Deinococcus deserti]